MGDLKCTSRQCLIKSVYRKQYLNIKVQKQIEVNTLNDT